MSNVQTIAVFSPWQSMIRPIARFSRYLTSIIAATPRFTKFKVGIALFRIVMLGACAQFPESMNASHRVGQIFIAVPQHHAAVNLSWTNGNVLRTYLFPRPIPYSISYGVAEPLKNRISYASQLEEATYVLSFEQEKINAFFRFTDNPLSYSVKVILRDIKGRVVAESGCGGTTSFGRMGIDEFFADPNVLRNPIQKLIDKCTEKISSELN